MASLTFSFYYFSTMFAVDTALGVAGAASQASHSTHIWEQKATDFGPLYEPLLSASTTFTSVDTGLEGLVRHAEEQCLGNIEPFLPGTESAHGLPVLEEGAQFHAAWLETQVRMQQRLEVDCC